MMKIEDFICSLYYKLNFLKKGTTGVKNQKNIHKIETSFDIFLKGSTFKEELGIVNLNPEIRQNWSTFISENYFHSCGCLSMKILSKYFLTGYQVFFENRVHESDRFCAAS